MVSTMMSLAFAVRFLITAEGSGIPACCTVSSKCHRRLVRSHSSHNGISSTGQQSENLRGHNGQHSLTSRKVRVAMSPVIWALPCAGNVPGEVRRIRQIGSWAEMATAMQAYGSLMSPCLIRVASHVMPVQSLTNTVSTFCLPQPSSGGVGVDNMWQPSWPRYITRF